MCSKKIAHVIVVSNTYWNLQNQNSDISYYITTNIENNHDLPD